MKTNLFQPKIKTKLCTVSAILIAVASIAGFTLAYFSDNKTAHNVITSGNVKIELQEWADENKTTAFKDLEGIMPGMEVTKIAEVKNTGDNTAWIRVQIEKGFSDMEEVDPSLIVLVTGKKWTAGEDGWYYYTEALAPNAVTDPIFETVQFAAAMPNEYQNKQAYVNVIAQAVQTANNGATVNEALGWPSSEE